MKAKATAATATPQVAAKTPKLRVNRPGDQYEQEAERVASLVTQTSKLHTGAAGGQPPAVTPDVETRIQALRGNGHPLPQDARALFEPRFGHDFGQVRVHTDADAAKAAQTVGARAFTLGQDVVFGAGQYAPHTISGQQLLAHELAHTIQQQSNPGLSSLGVIQRQPDDSKTSELAELEREYTRMYEMLPQPLQTAWQTTNLFTGFTIGFLEIAGKNISPELAQRIQAEIDDPLNKPALFAGYTVGIGEGALKDLGDNILFIWEVVKWLFWNLGPGATWTGAVDLYEWLTNFEEKKKKAAQKSAELQAFFDNLWQGLTELSEGLSHDPAFMLEAGEELGGHAGKLAADWYVGKFAPASIFEKGRMVGVPVGYLVMEIALLFLGPEEWVARGGMLAAQLGLKTTRAAGKVAKLLDSIPGIRKILEAFGGITKAGEAGTDVARTGGALTKANALIPGRGIDLADVHDALQKAVELGKLAPDEVHHFDFPDGTRLMFDPQKPDQVRVIWEGGDSVWRRVDDGTFVEVGRASQPSAKTPGAPSEPTGAVTEAPPGELASPVIPEARQLPGPSAASVQAEMVEYFGHTYDSVPPAVIDSVLRGNWNGEEVIYSVFEAYQALPPAQASTIATDVLTMAGDLGHIPGVEEIFADLAVGARTASGAEFELRWIWHHAGEVTEVAVPSISSKGQVVKGLDVLTTTRAVELKDYNLTSWFYTNLPDVAASRVVRQVERRLKEGHTQVEVVFSSNAGPIPAQFAAALDQQLDALAQARGISRSALSYSAWP